MNKSHNKTLTAYIGIISVVVIWAIVPIIKKLIIGNMISASFYSALTALLASGSLFILNIKDLKELRKEYFFVAVPTGLCLGGAALAQALAYNFNASPTNQAFLENLSCVIVPIILLIVIKKKPSILTVLSAVICLISSMVLSGFFGQKFSFCMADLLNAFAGLLYGVNIAITGIYAKKFVARLYVMIQLFVTSLLSFGMTAIFNYVCIGSSPIDKFVFTFDIWLIVAVFGLGVISNALCWTIRTSAMKYISPDVVAVIMPFSAAITGVFAIIFGQDTLTSSLLIGGVLGLAAGFMSASSDIKERRKT